MSGIFNRLFRRRSLDEDVREEIESHIEMQADLNRRSGMSPDEALRAARRQFGNVTAVRERLHDFYGFGWVETFIGDVRYAVRSLGRNPAVSLAAAVGVGAVAGMFGVLQTLLLAPPPHVETPDRVFRLHELFPNARGGAEPAQPGRGPPTRSTNGSSSMPTPWSRWPRMRRPISRQASEPTRA